MSSDDVTDRTDGMMGSSPAPATEGDVPTQLLRAAHRNLLLIQIKRIILFFMRTASVLNVLKAVFQMNRAPVTVSYCRSIHRLTFWGHPVDCSVTYMYTCRSIAQMHGVLALTCSTHLALGNKRIGGFQIKRTNLTDAGV